jgi:periplasmic protein TonB
MMAFTDNSGRVDPKSLGVTFAINGGLVIGLMLLGTSFVANDPGIIKIFNPYVEPPIVEPTPPPVATKKTLPTKSVVVPPVATKTAIDGENQTAVALAPLIIPGPSSGTGIEIQPPPIIPLTPPTPVFISAKRDPRFASVFQPDYPPGMVREEIEGSVIVRVLIGTDGRIKAVETVQSDHQAFFDATRKQALSRWRFKPATKDGVAVESWQQLTVRFQIPD